MRVTCLACGAQRDRPSAATPGDACGCGRAWMPPPCVRVTLPSERAARAAGLRALRAAGLVRDRGGAALTLALVALAVPPLAPVALAVGLVVLARLHGPRGHAEGRPAARRAVAVALAACLGDGLTAVAWQQARGLAAAHATLATAPADLRALLRAQRWHHALHGRFGHFDTLGFVPPHGQYTLYLGEGDVRAGCRGGRRHLDPLPSDLRPEVGQGRFVAIAVADIGLDPDAEAGVGAGVGAGASLDAWELTATGAIRHLQGGLRP